MIKISSYHLDCLKEVNNIASGNAATSLSQLLRKKIDINVSDVKIMPFSEKINSIGSYDENVVATLLRVLGDTPGALLFIMDKDKAYNIAKILINNVISINKSEGEQVSEDYSKELTVSVFQEFGNIVGNSYLNAINSFLDHNLLGSIPYLCIDMISSIISSAYIDINPNEDYVIDLNCKLIEKEIQFEMHIYFILSIEALHGILKKVDTLIE